MFFKRLLAIGGLLGLGLIGAACQPAPSGATPDIQGTLQAEVSTQLAQYTPAPDYQATITAQSTAIAGLQATASAVPATPDDTEALRQALLARLGWPADQLSFSVGEFRGQYATGALNRVNETSGAAWFAVRSNGQWVILHIGQGIPCCAELEPFNPPTDWISHCIDSDGTVIQR